MSGSFEMIRAIRLTVNPLPPDLVTPTLKIKRSVKLSAFGPVTDTASNVAAKIYRAEIDEMYAEIERAQGSQAIAKL